jgi:hypothetical protein
MKLISLLGSNGTGKSTRMTRLVEALGGNYTPIIVLGKEAGRIYKENKIAIIGKMGKNNKWNSMDSFKLTSWETRLVFFKQFVINNPEIDYLCIEGFFNMASKAGSPNGFKEIGFESSEFFFFYYDTVDEFLERINIRLLGKDVKTIEWAVISPGFRDNETRIKRFYDYFSEHSSKEDTVIRLDINYDENFLVKKLLNK